MPSRTPVLGRLGRGGTLLLAPRSAHIAGRAGGWLAAIGFLVVSAGCTDPNIAGNRWMCMVDRDCLAGFVCVEGICTPRNLVPDGQHLDIRTDGGPDGAGDGADRAETTAPDGPAQDGRDSATPDGHLPDSVDAARPDGTLPDPGDAAWPDGGLADGADARPPDGGLADGADAPGVDGRDSLTPDSLPSDQWDTRCDADAPTDLPVSEALADSLPDGSRPDATQPDDAPSDGPGPDQAEICIPVRPRGDPTCNGVDDDCDGLTDEDCAVVGYRVRTVSAAGAGFVGAGGALTHFGAAAAAAFVGTASDGTYTVRAVVP